MKNNFRLKAVEEKAYVTQSEYVIGVASSFVESFLFFSHERTQGGFYWKCTVLCRAINFVGS